MALYSRAKIEQNVTADALLQNPRSRSLHSRRRAGLMSRMFGKRKGRTRRMSYYDQVAEAAAFVNGSAGAVEPQVGIVLGSGLGAAAEAVEDPAIVPYCGDSRTFRNPPSRAIPAASWRACSAARRWPSCRGAFTSTKATRRARSRFPCACWARWESRAVVLTNAAGGILPGLHVGELVVLSRPHQPDGLESAERAERAALRDSRRAPGLRFFDMTEAYSWPLRALAKEAAREEGFALEEGVYLATPGPSFETPAEIRAFRALGATLVGMSTVPETIVARHMGIEVLGISCVTNLAAGLGTKPLSHEEVSETGRWVEKRLAELLKRVAPRLAERADLEE